MFDSTVWGAFRGFDVFFPKPFNEAFHCALQIVTDEAYPDEFAMIRNAQEIEDLIASMPDHWFTTPEKRVLKRDTCDMIKGLKFLEKTVQIVRWHKVRTPEIFQWLLNTVPHETGVIEIIGACGYIGVGAVVTKDEIKALDIVQIVKELRPE